MKEKTLRNIAIVLVLLVAALLVVLGFVIAGKRGEREETTETDSTSAGQEESPVGGFSVEAYKIDMAPYAGAVDTKEARFLLLVNKVSPYGTTMPDNLVESTTQKAYSFSEYRLNETALAALTAMCLEAEADGVKGIDITSAYRSYEWQETLFNRYCERERAKNPSLSREEAEKIVETYSCRAGTSEHQSGLAVDLRVMGDDSSLLNESFADTKAGKWLAENCTRFGFVLRFPADKTDVTGITYEPWHFRFVGYRAANEMKAKNFCLEEYTAYLDSLTAE